MGVQAFIGLKTPKKTFLTPHYSSNYTPNTIVKWNQNLILTTKTFKNGFLCIYRSKMAKKNISDSFSDQNKILTPHSHSNYTPIIIVKWTQNLILTNKWSKMGFQAFIGLKTPKKHF